MLSHPDAFDAPDADPFASPRPGKEQLSNRVTIEREIIGSVISNPACYRGARALRPDDFEDQDHQEVWRAIKECIEQALDLTPHRILSTSFLVKPFDLEDVARRSSGNADGVERIAHRIIESNRRRSLEFLLSRALGALKDGELDWREIAQRLEENLQSNAETGLVTDAASVRSSLVKGLMAQNSPAIPTGIDPLDRHLGGGVFPSQFIMAGALAKTGKTVFLTTISYNWNQAGVDHAFYTLERSQEEIERLKIARELGISARSLREHAHEVARLPPPKPHTRYLHSTSLDVEQIRHDTFFLKRRFGIRAALIDYWQLIQGKRKGETIQEHRARVAQEIQRTAIDAEIPIIMTCQIGDSAGIRDWEAAKTAANMFLQINRDRSCAETWFSVVTTNISEETDIGTVAVPPVVLDPAGPHFRKS